jgi:hypothetical protein
MPKLITGIIIGYLLASSIAYAVEMTASVEENPDNKYTTCIQACEKFK